MNIVGPLSGHQSIEAKRKPMDQNDQTAALVQQARQTLATLRRIIETWTSIGTRYGQQAYLYPTCANRTGDHSAKCITQSSQALYSVKHNQSCIKCSKKEEETRNRASSCVLQDLAAAFLDLLAATTATTVVGLARFPRRRWDSGVPVLLFDGHYSVHCQLEDRVHAAHLFAAALYVRCVHPASHCLALLRRDWCQALCFQKLNARSLVAQVRF